MVDTACGYNERQYNESGGSVICLCRGTSSVCLSMSKQITVSAINACSIILNIIHLLIITRFMKSKRTAYHQILVYMAATDVVTSMTLVVRACSFLQLLTLKSSIYVGKALSSLDSLMMLQLHILVIACLERYIALYYPLRYQLPLFTKNTGTWFTLMAAVSAAVCIIRDFAFDDTVCLSQTIGSTYIDSLPSVVITFVAMGLPAMLSFVLLILIAVKLLQMYITRLETFPEALRATAYIVIIVVIVFVCLLPPPVVVAMNRLFGVEVETERLEAFSVMGHGCYGIFNPIIYGWLSKPYRDQVMKIFVRQWRRLHSRLRPEADVGPRGGQP